MEVSIIVAKYHAVNDSAIMCYSIAYGGCANTELV